MSIKQYENQIYAGVLGKILGVYLGRPVEGWSYQKIQDTFGEVSYYCLLYTSDVYKRQDIM